MHKNHDALIILDFDHTLFNTTKFVKAMKQRFHKDFNIDEDHFMCHRDQIKEMNSVIDIENFAKAISKEDNIPQEKIRESILDILKTQAPSFIFPDVADFLERHKDTFDILISTHGDCDLQTQKIMLSQLPPYVDHIISTKGKDSILASYITKYNNVYFIDDKAKNIDDVKQTHPNVNAYFLKRPDDMPYGHIESECGCANKTIENLTLTLN